MNVAGPGVMPWPSHLLHGSTHGLTYQFPCIILPLRIEEPRRRLGGVRTIDFPYSINEYIDTMRGFDMRDAAIWRPVTLVEEWIRANIEQGNFHVSLHAQMEHTLREGFTVRQAIEALRAGELIQNRTHDCTCVFSGECPTVGLNVLYHGRYIHCVVKYDFAAGVLLVTLYRPLVSRWVDHRTAR